MGLVCGASVPIVGLEGVCGCSLMGLACGCCSLLGLAVAHRSLMGQVDVGEMMGLPLP